MTRRVCSDCPARSPDDRWTCAGGCPGEDVRHPPHLEPPLNEDEVKVDRDALAGLADDDKLNRG